MTKETAAEQAQSEQDFEALKKHVAQLKKVLKTHSKNELVQMLINTIVELHLANRAIESLKETPKQDNSNV